MDRYTAAATLGGQTERPTPEGESIVHMLADRVEELSSLTSRVRAFADRLSGGVPTGLAGNAKDQGAATAALPPINSRLRYTNDNLSTLLKGLSEEVNRLEAFA